MHRIRKVKGMLPKTVNEMISYALLAVPPMVLDFFLLYFFTETIGIHYLASVMLAYLLAAVLNYILQKKITFRNRSRSWAKQWISFLLIGGVGMLITTVVVYLLVEFAGLWYLLAKAIAIAVAYGWNFFGNKHITFRL